MSNLFEQFSLRVYESAAELYGTPLPKEVNERIEEELGYVSEPDVYKMMLIISDVFKEMGIATKNMPVIGYCEGFFLAYLLGINGGINPLPPHYRCAYCKHSDFDFIDVAIGVELLEKACPVCGNLMTGDGFNIPLQWVCLYNQYYMFYYMLRSDAFSSVMGAFRRFGFIGEIKEDVGAFQILSNRAELCLLPTKIEADFVSAPLSWQMANQLARLVEMTGVRLERIHFGNSPDTWVIKNALRQGTSFVGIQILMGRYTEKILEHFKLNGFYDLVRLFGIYHGKGVWFGNGELLLKNDTISQDELPVCLEDVFEYLQKAGFDRATAIAYTERIRKGERISEQEEIALHAHGVPQWFITSSNKIEAMGTRSRSISDAIMVWRLLYYKLCIDPGVFYQAYLETANINMELCWSIAKGEMDLVSTLESILRGDQSIYRQEEFTLLVAKEMMEQGFSFGAYLQRVLKNMDDFSRYQWEC